MINSLSTLTEPRPPFATSTEGGSETQYVTGIMTQAVGGGGVFVLQAAGR
jgi:hypothetical protein